jgi:hypothetical protein
MVFNNGPLEASLIIGDFEKVRQELISSTLGIDFLLSQIDYLKAEAKTKAVLSQRDEFLLKVCCGYGSRETDTCIKFNSISKREARKWCTEQSTRPAIHANTQQEAASDVWRLAVKLQRQAERYKAKVEAQTSDVDESEKERSKQPSEEAKKQENEPSVSKAECGELLAAAISLGADKLRMRRRQLELIESAEAERARSMLLSAPSRFNHFSRAETAVDRCMYRALAALTTTRAQGTLNLLPPPNRGPE